MSEGLTLDEARDALARCSRAEHELLTTLSPREVSVLLACKLFLGAEIKNRVEEEAAA